MKKISLFVIIAGLALSACKESYKKGAKGLEYKIISGNGGATLKHGDFMQMQLAQYYNNGKADSLLSDTRTSSGAMIQPLDTAAGMPIEYYNIFKGMKKGDSLVIKLSSDSMLKRGGMGAPPFVKKGNFFLTTVKLVNIFNTREQAESAYKADQESAYKATLQKDDKTIADYLAKNKINAQKVGEGTYVEIVQPGVGAQIDTTVLAKVFYIGKTMDDKIFDANMGTEAKRTEPLIVNFTSDMSLGNPVIKGWMEGLKVLNKGAKARLYIPSPLAYGSQSPGPEIPANSILKFDVEVADVMNKLQGKAEVEAQNKKMQEMQKKFMDSIRKAQAADTSAALKR